MLLAMIVNNDSNRNNINKCVYEYISTAKTSLLRCSWKTTITLMHNKYYKEVTCNYIQYYQDENDVTITSGNNINFDLTLTKSTEV